MRRREWDRKAQGKALYTRTEDYANEVSRLYSKAVNDLLALRKKYKLNDNKEFLYENDPKVAEEAQAILRSLYSAVYSAVTNDIKLEWNKANEEIDGFVKSTFGKQTLKEIGNNGWFERNTDALDAFLKRSNNGMNLSQRIWKYTDQFKDEMEMAMTVAIGEGSSAQHISKLVRKYLVEPDKLFRKVRTSTNEDGTPKYRLSKNAALYHPGRGVYRSSYKNAMRLTRTETNMAYRNADHERLQKLDFVIGVRINLSRSHPEPDICDTLAGDYPKGFKFTGWHPQCFCYATTILIDDKTNKEYIKASLRGKKMDLSKYQITDVPQAYKTWVKDNSERITNALHGKGELPYFLRDNGTVNDEGEYVIDAFDIPQQEESSIQPLSLAEIAERRHEARTETQIADIKARWNERNFTNANNYLKEFEQLLEKQKKEDEFYYFSQILPLEESTNLLKAYQNLQAQIQTIEAFGFKDTSTELLRKAKAELKKQIENLKAKDTPLAPLFLKLQESKVAYNEVQLLKKKLSTEEIIERLGDYDYKGSCSSLAFAYAGNRAGYDVLDFRGRKSRAIFADGGWIDKIIQKSGGTVLHGSNNYEDANELLKEVVIGKEYYFAVAKHAAIIRKTKDGFEFLELQGTAPFNGWCPLTTEKLKKRFGAQKSNRKKQINCIIDIEKLSESKDFKKMLGYINTEKEKRNTKN